MSKILIVDDIAANRKLLRKTLIAIHGCEVVEAENGEEAISQFVDTNPDLILMDINMPGMDGYQSTSEIKKIVGDNYIPIIFVTALSAKDSLSLALHSGGDDFISKPFDIEVLKSKINAHLRIRELNQQINEKNNKLTQVNKQLSYQHELIEHFFVNALQQSYLNENVIKYHMSSMSTFNGDVLLAERGPQGGVYVVMGDFTGHGLTAAMGTLPVALIFFKMVKTGASISDIARELNYQLNKLLPPGMFFTASLLEINARSDVLTIWMGGVPESYWLGASGDFKGEIHSQHMPLGILNDEEFDSAVEVFTIESGDTIYLCSDGITEAESSDGEMFGNPRLKKILMSCKKNRFETVLDEIKTFTGMASQSDDITFVELTCRDIPIAEKSEDSPIIKPHGLPWKLSIPLSEKDMRDGDPVTELSNVLGSIPALVEHKGVLHVLLSEMYANALDYSILGLDSLEKVNEERFSDYYKERTTRLSRLEDAAISIDLHFYAEQQSLYIKITDNGKGYAGNAPKSSDEQLRGRGLEIINSFCKNVSFSDGGKILEVVYPVS